MFIDGVVFAFPFYRECLDTELYLSAYPDAKGQPSSDPAARIMHSQLSHDGAPILMASDTPPGGGSLKPGNNFSVSIHCDSLDEIERLFSALGQSGKVRLPLGNMLWGGDARHCQREGIASITLRLSFFSNVHKGTDLLLTSVLC